MKSPSGRTTKILCALALLAASAGSSRAYASDIAKKVKSIIVDKLGVDEKKVTPSASFSALSLESKVAAALRAEQRGADLAALTAEAEKQYGIAIPPDQARTIKTLDQLIEIIGKDLVIEGVDQEFNITISEAEAARFSEVRDLEKFLKELERDSKGKKR